MPRPISVLIASAERNWADALAALLATRSFEVSGVVTSTNEYLAAINAGSPNVAVVSLSLQGIFESLTETAGDLAILCIGADSPDRMLEVLEAGAMGYLDFDAGFDEVGEALEQLARGHAVVPPAMLGTLLRRVVKRQRNQREARARLDELTRREREVFELLAMGLDKEAIASRLFISPQTARTHIQRVFRKLDVHSRGAAISLAAQCGLALSESED